MTITVEVVRMDGKAEDNVLFATYALAAPANWTRVTVANLGIAALPAHCRIRFSSDAEPFRFDVRDPVSGQNAAEADMAPVTNGFLMERFGGTVSKEHTQVDGGPNSQIWVKQA